MHFPRRIAGATLTGTLFLFIRYFRTALFPFASSYGTGDRKSYELPITLIAKEMVTTDQFGKKRCRPVAAFDSITSTPGATLGNHCVLFSYQIPFFTIAAASLFVVFKNSDPVDLFIDTLC